jgi:archaellin
MDNKELELKKIAFEQMDKNLYEQIFFEPSMNSLGMETNETLVLSSIVILIIVLTVFFNRNNQYTPGHHSIKNGAYYGAVLLVLGSYFLFKPSAATNDETNRQLSNRLNKEMVIVEEEKIKNEKNKIEKLKFIIDNVDKSGKLFYIQHEKTKELEIEDYGFGETEEKSIKHYYINENNYQKEYVEDLQQVESDYKNNINKNKKTAEFLAEVFENGNVFIKTNRKKARFFDKEVSKFKNKEKIENSVKAIKKVSI